MENNRNRRSASVPREFETRQGPGGGCPQNSGYGNFQYPRYNNNNNKNNQQFRSKPTDIATSPYSEKFTRFMLSLVSDRDPIAKRNMIMDFEDGDYPPPLMERFKGNRRNFQNQNRWNRNRENYDDYRYGFRNNGGFARRSQSQEPRRDFNNTWNDEYEDEPMMRQDCQHMNQMRQLNRTSNNKSNNAPVSRRNEEGRTNSSGRMNKFQEDAGGVIDDEFDLKMIEAFINDGDFPKRIAAQSSNDKNNNLGKMSDTRNRREKIDDTPQKMSDNKSKPQKNLDDRQQKMSDNRSRPEKIPEDRPQKISDNTSRTEKIPDDRNTSTKPKKKKPRLADAHSSSSENPQENSSSLTSETVLPTPECLVKNPEEFLKYLEESGKLAHKLETLPKLNKHMAVGEETVFEIETLYCMICKVQINKNELQAHLTHRDHYRKYHNYLSDLDVLREMQQY